MRTRITTAGRTLAPRLLAGAGAAALVGLPFGLLLALVRTKWSPLFNFDQSVTREVTGWVRQHPALVDALDAIAVIFSPNTFYVLCGLAAVWLWTRGLRRLAAWIAVTAATGSLLGVLLKVLVERARPLVDDPVAHAPGFSFPSGHALNSFLGCGILLLTFLPVLHGWRRVAAWATAVTVTVVTAFDRVALGVHYLSDVTAGWALALATLAGTMTGFRMWRREHGLRPEKASEGVSPEMSRSLPTSPGVGSARSG
jgi:undecaprenyl-diphosphatase